MLSVIYANITFYIVDQSPWSLISSLSAMLLLDGSALYMHGYQNGFLIALICLVSMFSVV